jgi:dihydrodipicolinate synthase/N-acetylneuraminate lyase
MTPGQRGAQTVAATEKRYRSVIMATCVVPWTAVFELDEERFRRGVKLQLDGLTKHLYLFGSAGEGYAVSDRQFARIAEVFWDEMQQGAGIAMLGIISLSLPTIVDRIELGRALGYREFQLSLPSWGALGDAELASFFRETCDRFPDCRFLHYNHPSGKRVLTGVEYARLAAAHPNFVAVKAGAQQPLAQLQALLEAAPQLQFFLGGSSYATARDTLECGWLISIGSTNHAAARRLFAARGKDLVELAQGLGPIYAALMEATGDGAHMAGVYDKLLFKLHDPDFPLRLLPPYASATDAMFQRLRELMPRAGMPGAVA